MSRRGVRATDARTLTTAVAGLFRDDPATRSAFSAQTHGRVL
jgi:GTP cyclohydrolase I